MKRCAIFLLLAASMAGQTIGLGTRIKAGTSLPGACLYAGGNAEIFIKTAEGLKWCNGGTWEAVGPATFALVTHQFLQAYDGATGLFAAAQPDTSDIVGFPGDATKYWDGTGSFSVPAGGGGGGSVTSVATASPITGGTFTTTGTIGIGDAAADGSTKGAAAFTASDFNAASGVISLDYTNGQAADASHKGFLTSTDWSTFNGKVSTSRSISTTSPLTGGGDLSADRTFTVSAATSSTTGVVKPDGTVITVDGAGAITVPDASSSVKGVVKVDGTTITASSGVISAVGGGGGGGADGHMTILPLSYSSIGQGTWALNIPITTQVLNLEWFNSSTANGDNITYKVDLSAGTYTLLLVYSADTNRGKVDVSIAGTVVATIDQYANTTNKNVRSVTTGIVISSGGIQDLKFALNGKNVSSSSFICVLTYIALWRTA